MSRRRSRNCFPPIPMYIMEDARGFTTACDASHEGMVTEAVRANLIGPITVWSWLPTGGLFADGWRLLDKWVWKGGRDEN